MDEELALLEDSTIEIDFDDLNVARCNPGFINDASLHRRSKDALNSNGPISTRRAAESVRAPADATTKCKPSILRVCTSPLCNLISLMAASEGLKPANDLDAFQGHAAVQSTGSELSFTNLRATEPRNTDSAGTPDGVTARGDNLERRSTENMNPEEILTGSAFPGCTKTTLPKEADGRIAEFNFPSEALVINDGLIGEIRSDGDSSTDAFIEDNFTDSCANSPTPDIITAAVQNCELTEECVKGPQEGETSDIVSDVQDVQVLPCDLRREHNNCVFLGQATTQPVGNINACAVKGIFDSQDTLGRSVSVEVSRGTLNRSPCKQTSLAEQNEGLDTSTHFLPATDESSLQESGAHAISCSSVSVTTTSNRESFREGTADLLEFPETEDIRQVSEDIPCLSLPVPEEGGVTEHLKNNYAYANTGNGIFNRGTYSACAGSFDVDNQTLIHPFDRELDNSAVPSSDLDSARNIKFGLQRLDRDICTTIGPYEKDSGESGVVNYGIICDESLFSTHDNPDANDNENVTYKNVGEGSFQTPEGRTSRSITPDQGDVEGGTVGQQFAFKETEPGKSAYLTVQATLEMNDFITGKEVKSSITEGFQNVLFGIGNEPDDKDQRVYRETDLLLESSTERTEDTAICPEPDSRGDMHGTLMSLLGACQDRSTSGFTQFEVLLPPAASSLEDRSSLPIFSEDGDGNNETRVCDPQDTGHSAETRALLEFDKDSCKEVIAHTRDILHDWMSDLPTSQHAGSFATDLAELCLDRADQDGRSSTGDMLSVEGTQWDIPMGTPAQSETKNISSNLFWEAKRKFPGTQPGSGVEESCRLAADQMGNECRPWRDSVIIGRPAVQQTSDDKRIHLEKFSSTGWVSLKDVIYVECRVGSTPVYLPRDFASYDQCRKPVSSVLKSIPVVFCLTGSRTRHATCESLW